MDSMKKARPNHGARYASQRGAVLLVALIMLLVVTMIGVSSMDSATLEEKVVSNMQSASKAFEGAEAALARCEVNIRDSKVVDLEVGGSVGVLNYDPANITANRMDYSFWSSTGSSLAATNMVWSSSNPEGLVAEPRCAIEYVGKVAALDLSEQYKGAGSAVKLVYLATAFSQGADTSTQAVVESVFVKQ